MVKCWHRISQSLDLVGLDIIRLPAIISLLRGEAACRLLFVLVRRRRVIFGFLIEKGGLLASSAWTGSRTFVAGAFFRFSSSPKRLIYTSHSSALLCLLRLLHTHTHLHRLSLIHHNLFTLAFPTKLSSYFSVRIFFLHAYRRNFYASLANAVSVYSQAVSFTAPVLRGMSPKLKPLLLPQLVEQRKRSDSASQTSSPDPNGGVILGPWPYVFDAPNSSSSDITSPVTPTFSTRGHVRMSSSQSSLDLPPLPQDGYVSPSVLPSTLTKTATRQLPDVEEEPLEKEQYQHIDDDMSDDDEDNFGLPGDDVCPRGNSSEDLFDGGLVGDFDIEDYDAGFLSDGDINMNATYGKKKRAGIESQLSGLTARLESRFPNITRWRSGRRSRMASAGTMEYSLDNVLSRAPSSRSSSISAIARQNTEGINEHSIPPTPALPFGSTESVNIPSLTPVLTEHDRTSIQRDRAMATTPLLPPLMTGPLGKPPPQSPLQSPTIESAPTTPMISSTAQSSPPSSAVFLRPSLSCRPSVQSLRNVSSNGESPLPLPVTLPSILQEHDEWSDRLGHANFTISPAPYDLPVVNPETIAKFQGDWDAARCNYTKHLVRTGENYGQTSKIYALTEAKWAETERRWRGVYSDVVKQTMPSVPMQKSDSRSRSRGRARGRSVSAHPGSVQHSPQGDAFAGMEWKRLEESMPSAVPQILEVLDAAQGKFPNRGDEDIVGPMHREASMAGAYNEDSRSRFWKSLGAKVGIHR
ncbi:hypothetical protein A9K55_001968 [Cordyceps militaris]|uniref:Only prolin and serin are matching in the corresponding protein n=1 Tax=Cordyceps militaris TaxID=73501 RepID=A0A2H4SR16_CORMI|nr:hypothetical protein A9K55_001968 [Cordyceps militaris]